MKHLFLFSVSIILLGCTKDKPGCTSSNALNYQAEATVDDGSCEFPTPLPSTYSTSFNVWDQTGNFTCAYVDLILLKADQSQSTIVLNDITTNQPYSYIGNFQELIDLGFQEGDSLKVIAEDCGWIYFDVQTRLIPYEGPGNVDIQFDTFLLD